MKERAFSEIWKLSPNVGDANCYQELVKYTRQIIEIYKDQGRLDVDPLESARKRVLRLPKEQLEKELKGAICLVSGGLGCIGSSLIKELLEFDVQEIVVIDKVEFQGVPWDDRIRYYQCDVLDRVFVAEIFSKHQPHIVFHTAAQRNPGLAEKQISESVTTNVFGTLRMVRAAENTASVRKFVFCSTGKASRYFTEEVYAATKKMCEYILDVQSRNSKIVYSMARFTHVVDNSLMDLELRDSVMQGKHVRIHSPGKFVTAQNAREASYLLLNSLLYGSKGRCNFLIVKNLEWPVESLELALYHISMSDKEIPIVFSGNPIGYTEKFFRGQMDWSKPAELNLLINVYENRIRRLNEAEDIIVSNIVKCSKSVLNWALDNLRSATTKEEVKANLMAGLKGIVTETLSEADKRDTVNILNWGLDKKILAAEKATASDYGAIIPMLFQSLENTSYYPQVEHLLEMSHYQKH
ncbi:polysaccharide biosynthesis protein [Algoriphagus aestuariicola]|uniref:Polysaccharide biosynthesis protein n=1 Tax=Algoriphagus aestuariicola TaxID=1852016 RepID=A0ABS3BQX9_9BACT|nr:polysaccharide biosynthesis protein [Algoriphagus aestuariicola]MBN7801485.1 polysaccharide biosynthesis protein [Algoriphagus aestuariicola]